MLATTLEEMEMGSTRMGVFPSDEGTVGVVLIHGEGYTPSGDGTVAYLYAGEDLQPALDRVVPNGGHVLLGKTEISPEMGYFALFIDSAGDRLGLHSAH